MSKRIQFSKTGGAEVLEWVEVEPAAPAAGEVRIANKAVGLNFIDIYFRTGLYPAPAMPSGLGTEGAGTVDAVGEGVRAPKKGERVATVPSFALSQTQQGVYGESAVVPAEVAVPYPANLSSMQGAAIWMQYLTAYGALVHYGGIGPDDVALITAASSSVGIAAIQIAKERGATAIATTRHSAKRAALLDIGADYVVATEEEDLPERVIEITDGGGARIAFDPVAGPMLTTLAAAAAPHGTIFEYGALHTAETDYPLMPMLAKSLNIVGYQVLDFVLDPARFGAAREYIFAGLDSGALTPVIDRIFPLDQIVAAHQHMESNTQCGKIVVTV
mgnify:CR=1 FL=1